MENNPEMAGLKENEIELELGLSLCGSLKAVEKLKPVKKVVVHNQRRVSGSDAEFSSSSNLVITSLEKDVVMEKAIKASLTKREIHALWRQQAKRKREEKLQKKGKYGAGNGRYVNGDFKDLGKFAERECKKKKTSSDLQGNSNGKHSAGCIKSGVRQALKNVSSNSSTTVLTQYKHTVSSYHHQKKPMVVPKEDGAIFETETTSNIKSNRTKSTASNKDKISQPQPLSVDQSHCLQPRMPCVVATGPHGKTINGFLYRYSNLEISIICACHGSSFSPVEFVQHAGGRDVSQPLRHITVLPSAFL